MPALSESALGRITQAPDGRGERGGRGPAGGGASEVVVWDGHDFGRSLSVLDIHPKAILFTGRPIPFTLGLDTSYGAVVFIGQHAMAGTNLAILSHSYDSRGIQNMWVNNKPTGEIGGRTLLAGALNIPVIMLSGDTAACNELHDLVPQAECAEVKRAASRTAGFMLSHPAACALIREKGSTCDGAAGRDQALQDFRPRRTEDRVHHDGRDELRATGGRGASERPHLGVPGQGRHGRLAEIRVLLSFGAWSV